MKRYLGQRDHYRCGPIALLNLNKWLGRAVTGNDLRHHERLCGCRNPNGTSSRDFSGAVGNRGRRLSYTGFKRLIESGGGAVILTHAMVRRYKFPKYRHAHFWFVPGIGFCDTGHGFIAVNFSDETMTMLSWSYMKWLLSHSTVWPFYVEGERLH
jgi:hypothetical protein